jgi:hypothetical protein
MKHFILEKCKTGKIELTEKDERPDSDYDSKQLAMGVKAEMEHTSDKAIAKRISKDHLDEIKDYYTKLKKMEAK